MFGLIRERIIKMCFYFRILMFYLYLHIYFVCLSIGLYPINIKTAEPIGSKFVVGPRVTPRKVYE